MHHPPDPRGSTGGASCSTARAPAGEADDSPKAAASIGPLASTGTPVLDSHP